ncbi:hypothetical protein [Streptomyces aquilus]|uniref:hypothetical protein n=1 Tax=Streptomyces aquilus TaxID=2548456 RepID=UPI0036B0ABBB
MIIDEWLKDESSLDYVKEDPDPEESSEIVTRRVSGIFGRLGYQHHVLDPDFFAMCTFNELHGGKDRDSQSH